MRQKKLTLLLATFILAAQLTGCRATADSASISEQKETQNMQQHATQTSSPPSSVANSTVTESAATPEHSASAPADTHQNTTPEPAEETMMQPTAQSTAIVEGLSMVRYAGDYGFDAFLKAGGATSDEQVVRFLLQNGLSDTAGLSLQTGGFGCSTVSVKQTSGGMLFGRNFDWQACDALVVTAAPQNGYASVSTVNLDFLSEHSTLLPDAVRTLAALYAPLDGLNEKGLAAAVLMIADTESIDQNTEKPDLTTTTAIRLLLDQAATVEEAIALLEQYDLHASMGMMVHFALADAAGNSVVVEYINNTMTVVQTPVVTNFYLAAGEKNGAGSAQSHTRYEMLLQQLKQTPTMDAEAVRDALKSVSKQNFGEFESTEWSIVYDQSRGTARYYHREDYEKSYTFAVK